MINATNTLDQGFPKRLGYGSQVLRYAVAVLPLEEGSDRMQKGRPPNAAKTLAKPKKNKGGGGFLLLGDTTSPEGEVRTSTIRNAR